MKMSKILLIVGLLGIVAAATAPADALASDARRTEATLAQLAAVGGDLVGAVTVELLPGEAVG